MLLILAQLVFGALWGWWLATRLCNHDDEILRLMLQVRDLDEKVAALRGEWWREPPTGPYRSRSRQPD